MLLVTGGRRPERVRDAPNRFTVRGDHTGFHPALLARAWPRSGVGSARLRMSRGGTCPDLGGPHLSCDEDEACAITGVRRALDVFTVLLPVRQPRQDQED
jgi:hypothetical protein